MIKNVIFDFDGIIADIEGTTQDLSEIDLKSLAGKIEDLAGELDKTTSAINDKEGSLGLLVHDKKMYNDLDATVLKLKSLIEDIEKYPKRYFSLTNRQAKKAEEAKAAGE